MATKKEKIEYIALPALFLVLIIAMWRFVFSSEEPPAPLPTPAVSTAQAAKPKPVARNVPISASEPATDETKIVALELSRLTRKPVAVGKTERGNIFNFWVAPPPPPKPPDPPPPIVLTSVEPRQVFAMTKAFTLKVRGSEFPPSSKIYIDTSEYATTHVSDTELSAAIPETFIRSAGSHKVLVRSSDPKLTHSNDAALMVTAPPAPPYSYVGLITGSDGVTAILTDRDTRRSVQKGQKLDSRGRWLVVDINAKEMQVRDTELDILHKLPFRGDS